MLNNFGHLLEERVQDQLLNPTPNKLSHTPWSPGGQDARISCKNKAFLSEQLLLEGLPSPARRELGVE